MTPTPNEIRRWMSKELKRNLNTYLDDANILNATKLAENADIHFYPENIENPDELLFEIAVDIVEIETIIKGYNR